MFCKVFRKSCGPPTRSVGPTDRSAGLLVGRTHLSGTAVSLVGGDLGVPMSHTRKDHWVNIPDPRTYPLVINPIVDGVFLP
jgi:hypothetical protein